MAIKIDLDTPEDRIKAKRTLLIVELLVEIYPWSDKDIGLLIRAIRHDENELIDWLSEVTY